jgi:hypothetical protein
VSAPETQRCVADYLDDWQAAVTPAAQRAVVWSAQAMGDHGVAAFLADVIERVHGAAEARRAERGMVEAS